MPRRNKNVEPRSPNLRLAKDGDGSDAELPPKRKATKKPVSRTTKVKSPASSHRKG